MQGCKDAGVRMQDIEIETLGIGYSDVGYWIFERHVWNEDIVASYPSLTIEAVRAAVAYAAELTRECIVSLPD